MREAERDEVFWSSAEAAGPAPKNAAAPMDALLAELLNTWQDPVAAAPLPEEPMVEPDAAPAGLECGSNGIAGETSVSALMGWLIEATPVTEPVVPATETPLPEAIELSVAEEPEPEFKTAAERAPFELEPAIPPSASAEVTPTGDSRALEALLNDMHGEWAATQPAPPSEALRPGQKAERFLAFELAGESFAVALTRVLEVDRLPKVTRLPGMPGFVRGAANLRGSILPLVDLRLLLELEAAQNPAEGRIVVVRPSPCDEPLALVVDSLLGVAQLAREELHHPPRWLEAHVTPYLDGIGSHKGRLVSVLDLDKVFVASELQQQRAAT